jgi:hypothetical protein
MPIIVMPKPRMLSVIVLSVIMLSVAMLSVALLNVVAPFINKERTLIMTARRAKNDLER